MIWFLLLTICEQTFTTKSIQRISTCIQIQARAPIACGAQYALLQQPRTLHYDEFFCWRIQQVATHRNREVERSSEACFSGIPTRPEAKLVDTLSERKCKRLYVLMNKLMDMLGFPEDLASSPNRFARRSLWASCRRSQKPDMTL